MFIERNVYFIVSKIDMLLLEDNFLFNFRIVAYYLARKLSRTLTLQKSEKRPVLSKSSDGFF